MKKSFPFLAIALLPLIGIGQNKEKLSPGLQKVKAGSSKQKYEPLDLQQQFLAPPLQARPLVYWFWMGSNFSKTGITKDLEAMKAMGLGGGIIMNITSAVEETHSPTLNNPWPHQTYRSPAYWEALAHAAAEAKRLGLEIGIHNTVGYSTTGGPWINEDKSMKKLVWSTAIINGQSSNHTLIPPPAPVVNITAWGRRGLPPLPSTWYKDIAYLAIPLKDTASYQQCQDFTSHFDTSGKLIKPLPAGEWMVYRLGYAPTMSTPHPLPDELLGKCQEVDKMNKDHSVFHWNEVLLPIKQYLHQYVGNSFKYMHIDSYEAKGQNWTTNFRNEFIKLKGYDPLPWLLTLTPTVQNEPKANTLRIKGSKQETARFEWDYKDVINRLFYENGWNIAQKMIHANGMQLSWEPYGGPFEAADGALLADFLMGEFWTYSRGGVGPTVPASGRAAGKTIIGAEAFTSLPQNSKWTDDPEFLKPSGDAAFASGVNRFVLHHWAQQPFDDKYQPGMDMGWWGTHFSRHQTWFKPGKAFINYLSRSQALLQWGQQVADVLYVGKLEGYGDVITVHQFLTHPPKVMDGKVVLASGRVYKYIIVPGNGEMLPAVAEQIERLVNAGAMVVAAKPTTSPSLQAYPNCDTLLHQLSRKVWGANNHQQYGKGFIFTSVKSLKENVSNNQLFTPDYQVEPNTLKASNSANQASFAPKVVHRQSGNTHVFFVLNHSEQKQQFTLSFNVQGLQPELWQAEDGNIINAPVWQQKNNRTHVWLNLRSQQTIFVVFRKKATEKDHATSLDSTHAFWQVATLANGQPVLFTDTIANGVVNYASGKKQIIQTNMPNTTVLSKQWRVNFVPKLDSAFSVQMDTLIDFSKHTNLAIKYFSGTATYSNVFIAHAQDIKTDKRWILRLGVVNDMVEVMVNKQAVCTLWHPPYSVDITQYLQPGNNTIRLAVTNNWANRLIGDEQIPADFEWGNDRGDKGHAIKAYPDWFIRQLPRPSKRKAFSIWYYNRKDTPLHPAGLVGPVRLERVDAQLLE